MPTDVPGTIDAVVEGVRERRYDEARLDRSVRRVLAWKHRLGLHRERLVEVERVRRIVGDSAHVEVARRVAERALGRRHGSEMTRQAEDERAMAMSDAEFAAHIHKTTRTRI